MYVSKLNGINLPAVILLLSMIVLSVFSTSRPTPVSKGQKITTNL